MREHPLLLVVDDDAAVRRMIRALLERAGYGVLEAVGGQEALQLYRGNMAEIGLVVTDLRMPDMDGNELVRRIHELSPSQKILFTTAHESGVDDSILRFEIIRKPFNSRVLLAKVNYLLTRNSRSFGA